MVESAQKHLKQTRKFLVLVGLGEILELFGVPTPQESADIHHPPNISPITEASWWLNQPIWKICSSNWIISPGIGVKIPKIFELPPPRKWSSLIGNWYHSGGSTTKAFQIYTNSSEKTRHFGAHRTQPLKKTIGLVDPGEDAFDLGVFFLLLFWHDWDDPLAQLFVDLPKNTTWQTISHPSLFFPWYISWILEKEGLNYKSSTKSMVVSGSPKRWDRWHSPSPNWQEKCYLYTTYSPCLLGGEKCNLFPTF